jgi:hypothetical protein
VQVSAGPLAKQGVPASQGPALEEERIRIPVFGFTISLFGEKRRSEYA